MMRNNLRCLAFLLSAVFALFASGCSSMNQPDPSGNYVLTSINGEKPAVDGVSMTVKGNEISGDGPVNLWRGTVTDGKLGPMISTRRAGPPEAMQMEHELNSAMDGATMTLDGAQLIFAKGDTRVVFTELD